MVALLLAVVLFPGSLSAATHSSNNGTWSRFFNVGTSPGIHTALFQQLGTSANELGVLQRVLERTTLSASDLTGLAPQNQAQQIKAALGQYVQTLQTKVAQRSATQDLASLRNEVSDTALLASIIPEHAPTLKSLHETVEQAWLASHGNDARNAWRSGEDYSVLEAPAGHKHQHHLQPSRPRPPVASEQHTQTYGISRYDTLKKRFSDRFSRQEDAASIVIGLFKNRDELGKRYYYFGELSEAQQKRVKLRVQLDTVLIAIRQFRFRGLRWRLQYLNDLFRMAASSSQFYRPHYELVSTIPDEKSLADKNWQLRDEVVRVGQRYMAHGVEARKGGIRNLLDILITGQILAQDGSPYFGRLGVNNSEFGAASHGPYYILVDESKNNPAIESAHLYYLVPSETHANILRQALQEAVDKGLITPEINATILGKIKTYKQFIHEEKIRQSR